MFFRKKTCRTGSRFANCECATQYALRGFLAASYPLSAVMRIGVRMPSDSVFSVTQATAAPWVM